MKVDEKVRHLLSVKQNRESSSVRLRGLIQYKYLYFLISNFSLIYSSKFNC